MADIAPKNPPSGLLPAAYNAPTTIGFSLSTGQRQVAFIPVQAAFRLPSLVCADKTTFTFEVTCNPISDITATTAGTGATWATVTLASNFYTIPSSITAVRLTATAATTAYICI